MKNVIRAQTFKISDPDPTLKSDENPDPNPIYQEKAGSLTPKLRYPTAAGQIPIRQRYHGVLRRFYVSVGRLLSREQQQQNLHSYYISKSYNTSIYNSTY